MDMKTTIEIPDAIFRQAKMKAAQEGRTFKDIVVSALQNDLLGHSPNGMEKSRSNCADHITIDQSGWPVLKRDSGDDTLITNDLVNDLREELGV